MNKPYIKESNAIPSLNNFASWWSQCQTEQIQANQKCTSNKANQNRIWTIWLKPLSSDTMCEYTRGIWKVRSMVQFFSNRLTNPFMFGIFLNSYLCYMFGNKFEMEDMWQVQYILLWIHILFGHWKTQILMKLIKFYFSKMVHKILLIEKIILFSYILQAIIWQS